MSFTILSFASSSATSLYSHRLKSNRPATNDLRWRFCVVVVRQIILLLRLETNALLERANKKISRFFSRFDRVVFSRRRDASQPASFFVVVVVVVVVVFVQKTTTKTRRIPLISTHSNLFVPPNDGLAKSGNDMALLQSRFCFDATGGGRKTFFCVLFLRSRSNTKGLRNSFLLLLPLSRARDKDFNTSSDDDGFEENLNEKTRFFRVWCLEIHYCVIKKSNTFRNALFSFFR